MKAIAVALTIAFAFFTYMALSATATALQSFESLLTQIARRHQKDLWRYRRNPAEFKAIFPPNPGASCRYCPFHSICQFSMPGVAA